MPRERVIIAKCSRGRLTWHFSGRRSKRQRYNSASSRRRRYYYKVHKPKPRPTTQQQRYYSKDDYYIDEINKNFAHKRKKVVNGVTKYDVFGAYRSKEDALKWVKKIDDKIAKARDSHERSELQFVKDDLLGRIGMNLLASSFHYRH